MKKDKNTKHQNNEAEMVNDQKLVKSQITPKLGSGSFGCTITVKEGMDIEADKLGEHRKTIKQFLQKKMCHI